VRSLPHTLDCRIGLSRLVPEHRLADEFFDAGPIFAGIVELVDVDAFDTLERGIRRHRGVDAVLDGYHQAAMPLEELVDGHVAIRKPGHAVDGVWSARAHQVANGLVDDVNAGDFFDGVAGDLTDSTQLLVAVGVFFTVLDRLTVEHVGTL